MEAHSKSREGGKRIEKDWSCLLSVWDEMMTGPIMEIICKNILKQKQRFGGDLAAAYATPTRDHSRKASVKISDWSNTSFTSETHNLSVVSSLSAFGYSLPQPLRLSYVSGPPKATERLRPAMSRVEPRLRRPQLQQGMSGKEAEGASRH